MSEKKLSISLLVSGREDTTEKCLDSIRPLQEQLDAELILVDTGCTPELKDRLRTYTDCIIPFTWCDDFAKARNAGLEQATGEWFLYLDDDEWFEDVSPLIAFFQSEESREYAMALYKVRNYSDHGGTTYQDQWVRRILRRTKELRFHGRVHENPEPVSGRCKKIDAFVHHYGYIFDTEEDRQRHFERNSKLLHQLLVEEPDEPRWKFQMLQEYQMMGMGEEMRQLAEESARQMEGETHPFKLLLRENYLCAGMEALKIQKKYRDILQALQTYFDEKPCTDAGHCALAFFGALASSELGEYGQCAEYSRKYLELYGKCHSSKRDEQDRIIEETMLFIGIRIDRVSYRNMCMMLCGSLCRMDRADEVPEAYREEAAAYLEEKLGGNANFLDFAEEFKEMGIRRVVPVEDMLLGLELSQWMAQVQVLCANSWWEKWRDCVGLLRQLKTREDIRYAYFFNSYYLTVVTKRDICGMGYASMRRFLAEMSDAFISYAHTIYAERVFTEAEEMLPEHVAAAMHIEELLQADESDVEAQKQQLDAVAQVWPAFAPAAEHFGKLLGQRRKRPLISIAVMASNRRDTIETCLRSLAVIRETIPCELIVLDTGCSKPLHDTLAEYADKVDCFTWCNDFSAARNRTIEMAEGEWYLYLDDDEWFVDVQELLDFFTSGEYRGYDCASYIQRNFLDKQGAQYTDAWVSRMVRLTPEMHFESKIHEYFEPGGRMCKGLRSVVHHFGYVFESEEALRRHYERNRTLLLEMMEQEPDNIRWWVQLIQEYRSVNENQELYDFGEKCLRKMDGRDDEVSNIYLGSFYAARIASLKATNKWEEGLAECRKAVADKRNTPLFRAYAAHKMTGFCYWLGDYDGVETHAAEYLSYLDFYGENEPLLFLHKRTVLVGECFDDVMVKEVYSELILGGLKRGDSTNLLKYIDFLAWDKPHAYVFEDMVPTLLELETAMADDPGFERLFDVMSQNSALMEYYLQQKTLMEKRKMSGPIKEQLRLLLANGMKEQARQILPSIREMLPEDDEELEELYQRICSDEDSVTSGE